MTAEIAILNRTAVALAADSAATLGNGKIFNTVDKLFQLVCNRPIGIMIYGGAEFMSVPFETVIKKFRASHLAEEKKSVREYSEEFFKFLETQIPVKAELEAQFVEMALRSLIQQVRTRAENQLFKQLTQNGQINVNIEDESQKALDLSIKVFKRALAQYARCDSIDVDEVRRIYNDLIRTEIESVFNKLPTETKSELANLCFETLVSSRFSNFQTGVVFAGFGSEEIFPSLLSCMVDGLLAGKVKRLELKYIDIDRAGEYAAIEPFAQKEMVERFLYGVDPDYERFVNDSVSKIIKEFGHHIVEKSVTRNNRRKRALDEAVDAAVDSCIENFQKLSQKEKIEKHHTKILDMVQFMPKSDIAKMAESLVELTSTKRKVSAESETVGGPIDVAVISKFDGFIWIKRKHYFSPELNPRFFDK